jgi:hypothetical protein
LIANIGGKRYRYDSSLSWFGGGNLDDNTTFQAGRISRYSS